MGEEVVSVSAELKSIRNRLAGLLRDVDALLADEPATTAPPRALDPTVEAAFEIWWKNYPLKVGKAGARAAYKAATKKAPLDALLAGLQCYKFSDDRKYLPHATTWLNQERWADEQVERTSQKEAPDARRYDDVFDDLFNENDPA